MGGGGGQARFDIQDIEINVKSGLAAVASMIKVQALKRL